MSSAKKKRLLPVNFELTAISLAANKAGLSYGQFTLQLSDSDREIILREYLQQICLKKSTEEPSLPPYGAS